MNSGRLQRLLAFTEKYFLEILIAALALSCLVYEVYTLCFMPQYTEGDWLINYSQGFVRRGLPGEVILILSHLTHIPASIVTVVVQLCIYAVFLRCFYKLVSPLRRDFLWYALVLCPATVTFMITNTMHGCHKEVLLHTALAITTLLVLRKTPPLVLSLHLTVFFAVVVLSHETLACCFPYFFAAVAVGAGSLRVPTKVLALPSVVTVVLEAIVRKHIGNLAVAQGICRSVNGKWVGNQDTNNLCSGAIGHISWTMDMYRQEELRNLHFWPQYVGYALLSLLPLVAALVVLYRRDGKRFEVRVIASCAVLAAIGSAPLFYFAIDWGRWIFMQTNCLFLVILLAARYAKSFQKDYQAAPIAAGTAWRKPLIVMLVIYCTLWTLPTNGISPTRWGYFNIPKSFYECIQFTRHYQPWDQVDRGF